MSESKRGYPQHRLLALGHMAEAEEELLQKYPKQAGVIRQNRIRLQNNPSQTNNLMNLLNMVDKECDECAYTNAYKCRAGQKYSHKLGRCV